MKAILLLIPFLVLSFCLIDTSRIKDPKFRSLDLLNKRILLVPINLGETESGILKDKSVTKLESEIIAFNDKVKNEIIEKLNSFKIHLNVLAFHHQNISIFLELYKELEKNHTIIKKKQKDKIVSNSIEDPDNPIIQIYHQPNLKNLIKIETNNDLSVNADFDYLLLYRINYFSNSKERKIVTSITFAAFIVLALALSKSGPNIQGDWRNTLFERGELQFILIDNKKKKVVSFGKFFNLFAREEELNKKTIIEFVNYIFELDIKSNNSHLLLWQNPLTAQNRYPIVNQIFLFPGGVVNRD